MIKVTNKSEAPVIEIDQADVEKLEGMGGGPTVCDVVVNHTDGRTSRFFISVQINKQGRAVGEIATNGPKAFSKSSRKTVCAYKHDNPDK